MLNNNLNINNVDTKLYRLHIVFLILEILHHLYN